MLELRGITKEFPGVRALDDVSISFREGEIHALVGENGAGKSTLIKIVCGIYQPDKGEIYLNDERLRLHSFSDALAKGINLVNQEIQVIPGSTIAENIMLDKMVVYGKTGVVNWKAVNKKAQQYMDMVGLDIPPTTVIGGLSAGQKQLVQIAKALASDAKLLLLDEPTSSITEHEANNLFQIIGELKRKGVIIVFVSHKLDEVFKVADRISVLRDGRCVGSAKAEDLDKPALIKLMIGRDYTDEFLGHLDVDPQDKVLEVRNLSKRGKVYDVNFQLRRGEILGFYGLIGSGRTELAKILIGEDHPDSGEIYINGKKATIRRVSDSLYKYKMGYVTENRKEEGLLLDSTVKTNITITIWHRILHTIFRFVHQRKESDLAQKMIDALEIRVTSMDQTVKFLSGGNQQKVSISKWLVADSEILIIDEPTVGVDVGAKEYIHRLIWDLAKKEKKSIILISSDMPEMVKLARRILVFKDKRIVGEIDYLNNRLSMSDDVTREIGRCLA